MSKLRKISLVMVFLALLLPASLPAVSVQTLNLVQLVSRADRVFEGQCISAVKTDQQVAGFPIIEYTFTVTRAIKGTREGSNVVFHQLQAGGKQMRGMPGMPSYEVGDRVVLLLKKESRLGLTSPVGLGQGIFALKRNPEGEATVVNLAGNMHLTEGLTPESGSLAGLSAADYRLLQQGQPIPLGAFTSIITRIARSGSVDDRTK